MEPWLPLINTFGLVVVAVVTYVGNRETHKIVNSRMSEMLILARKAGKSDEADRERGQPSALQSNQTNQPIPVADEHNAVAAEKSADALTQIAETGLRKQEERKI